MGMGFSYKAAQICTFHPFFGGLGLEMRLVHISPSKDWPATVTSWSWVASKKDQERTSSDRPNQAWHLYLPRPAHGSWTGSSGPRDYRFTVTVCWRQNPTDPSTLLWCEYLISIHYLWCEYLIINRIIKNIFKFELWNFKYECRLLNVNTGSN